MPEAQTEVHMRRKINVHHRQKKKVEKVDQRMPKKGCEFCMQ